MIWSKRKYMMLGTSVLMAGAAIFAATTMTHRPRPVTVPQQTPIQVRLNQSLNSEASRPGDRFTATVAQPVIINNRTIIPQGTGVQGIVVDARKSGHLKGRARLALALQSMTINGKTYEVRTASDLRVGGRHKNHDLGWIGGGAGGGLLIGAIVAGGKGALIGGPIGAGAGTAAAYFTGKKDIYLPAETALTFKLVQPVTVNIRT